MRIPGRAVLDAEDYLILGTALLLPWAFGGVELWASRSAALGCVAAAALAYIKRGPAGLGLDRRARWLWPAGLLALWAAVQLVPLPPPVVRWISPTADAIYAETFPGYRGAAPASTAAALEAKALTYVPEVEGLPAPADRKFPFDPAIGGRWHGWRPLSLLPAEGLESLHWYLALLLGFLLVRARTRRAEVARAYRNAVFAMFFLLAVFGLVYSASGNGKLYWIRPTLFTTNPIGPYVNPTNFAGMMELAVPWLLGAALLLWRRRRGAPLKDLRAPVFAAGALLCLLGGLAAGSKSAALLLAGGVAVVALLAVRSARARVLTLTLMVLGGGAGWLILRHLRLGQRIQEFLETTGGNLTRVDRLVAWKSTAPMLGDYWLSGTGFGAFRDVYPHYMPAGETARWTHLHNDYLQFAVEGGLIGALLLVWLLAGFLRRVSRRATVRARDGLDLESLGLIAGLGLLFIHAAFDFNHQIPANALMFVVMAALLVGRGDRRSLALESPP